MKPLNTLVLSLALSMGVSLTANANEASEALREHMASTICTIGAINYTDASITQCRVNGTITDTLNAQDEYQDRTITIYADSAGRYTPRQINLLVSSLRDALGDFGMDKEIAQQLRTLPFSADGNKTTLIKGAKFNIPDLEHSTMYNNYMVTLTK